MYLCPFVYIRALIAALKGSSYRWTENVQQVAGEFRRLRIWFQVQTQIQLLPTLKNRITIEQRKAQVFLSNTESLCVCVCVCVCACEIKPSITIPRLFQKDLWYCSGISPVVSAFDVAAMSPRTGNKAALSDSLFYAVLIISKSQSGMVLLVRLNDFISLFFTHSNF